MRRRYDLERSDNFMFTGRVSQVVSTTNGTIKVVTGFPVTSATVSFAVIPWPSGGDSSSSSSSSEIDIPETNLPRILVSSFESDGFVVTFENIPEAIGFVEFNFAAA